MLYILVEIHPIILHAVFFYDIIIIGRHGQLFQNRYKSVVNDEDPSAFHGQWVQPERQLMFAGLVFLVQETKTRTDVPNDCDTICYFDEIAV